MGKRNRAREKIANENGRASLTAFCPMKNNIIVGAIKGLKTRSANAETRRCSKK